MTENEKFMAMIAGLEDHGLSRSEIAEQSGLSKATIWRYATGTVRDPLYSKVKRIERLCTRYSVIPVSPVK